VHVIARECSTERKHARGINAALVHARAMHVDLHRRIILVLQQHVRKIRAFAHHNFAHGILKARRFAHTGVDLDYLCAAALIKHHQ
jgi:hypothetical protein